MKTHPLVRVPFVVSVWLLIGVSALQFAQFLMRPEFYQSIPPPFQARVVMGPLVLAGMELFFWFRFFARERDGARVFAAMTAFFMFVLVFLSLASNLPDNAIGHRYFWVYAIAAVTHSTYAIGGRERSW